MSGTPNATNSGPSNLFEKHDPEHSVGAWSMVSLALAAFGIFWFLLPHLALARSAAGPAEGAGMLVVTLGCYFLAGLCVALGTAGGWLGVRRGPGRLGWAAFRLNEALCILGVFLTVISVSHYGGLLPAAIVLLLGALFTSLILVKDSTTRRVPAVLFGLLVLCVAVFLLRIW